MCASVRVSVRACEPVSEWACVRACVCVGGGGGLHITRHTHTHRLARTGVRACVSVRACKHVCECEPVCVRANLCVCVCVCVRARARVRTSLCVAEPLLENDSNRKFNNNKQ